MFIVFAVACGFSAPSWGQAESDHSVNAQLLVAARQGDADGVRKSLERGAAPDSRNRLGKTTLYLAIEKDRIDLVKIMLEAGADVNLATVERVTPLIAAAYAGDPKVVELLLTRQPRLEDVDRLHKSALIYAAGMGHHDVVAALLSAGAKIDAAYIDGLTPLMWAAGQGQAQTVRLLLERGANRSLQDDRGLTALDVANQNHQQAVVDLLQAAP